MSDKLVTIARFQSPIPAHLAQGRLESEGLEAILLDETMNRMLGGVYGRIRLAVPADQADLAKEILGDLEEALQIEGSEGESADKSYTDRPLSDETLRAELASQEDVDITRPPERGGLSWVVLVAGILFVVIVLTLTRIF
jgi:hypothetical protein